MCGARASVAYGSGGSSKAMMTPWMATANLSEATRPVGAEDTTAVGSVSDQVRIGAYRAADGDRGGRARAPLARPRRVHPRAAAARPPVAAQAVRAGRHLEPLPEPDRAGAAQAVGRDPPADRPGAGDLGRDPLRAGRHPRRARPATPTWWARSAATRTSPRSRRGPCIRIYQSFRSEHDGAPNGAGRCDVAPSALANRRSARPWNRRRRPRVPFGSRRDRLTMRRSPSSPCTPRRWSSRAPATAAA